MPDKYKPLILWGSIAVIILTVIGNIYFFLIAPSAAQPSHTATYQELYNDPANIDPTTGQHLQFTVPATTTATASNFPLAMTLAIVALIGGSVGLAVLAIKMNEKNQVQRDAQRQQDLIDLAHALQAYRQAQGHYPISSSYQADYYTGINLSNDWHYYGLPTDDQMRQFLPRWPISDPGIDYHGKNQVNQYIYFPRNQGAQFDLYAHLETGDAGHNYNKEDSLPNAWGQYNFKINSQNIPAAPIEIQPAIKPVVPEQPVASAPAPAVAASFMDLHDATSELPADTNLEPQAALQAQSANISQDAATASEMDHINDLFETGSSQPVVAAPAVESDVINEVASTPEATPAPAPVPANSLMGSQLDRLANAVAARNELLGPATDPIPTSETPASMPIEVSVVGPAVTPDPIPTTPEIIQPESVTFAPLPGIDPLPISDPIAEVAPADPFTPQPVTISAPAPNPQPLPTLAPIPAPVTNITASSSDLTHPRSHTILPYTPSAPMEQPSAGVSDIQRP